MNRLRPKRGCVETPQGLEPGLDRDHWERIAEEALARVFEQASGGLPLPGLDGRRTDADSAIGDPATEAREPQDRDGGRLGFRLGLTQQGTSFTPSIGACFRFESLRDLIAASGRHLGLKAVIVVHGEVVLLPALPNTEGPLETHSGGSVTPTILRRSPTTAVLRPFAPRQRSLLGLAKLVIQASPPASSTSPELIGPALSPLWQG